MSIFDKMADAIANFGGIIPNTIDDARHGEVFSINSFFYVAGDPKRARDELRNCGIDAWGTVQANKKGTVSIHPSDKKRAMKMLSEKGYDVW